MTRWFNTAGPCDPALHYMIPASARLPDVPGLVARHGYFVVHAPRQTGKTTTLRTLAQELTATGRYAAVLTSCEPGRPWAEDVAAAERAILRTLGDKTADALPAELRPPAWPEAPAGAVLSSGLTAWSRVCPRPVVLFLDEIDALEGRTLISVLSQLRSGATERPANFPMSVAICGLRDLRDCHPRNRFAIPRVPGTASGGNANRLGGPSPFNIIVKSLRLGNFTPHEIGELYGQHTADTGQPFTDRAVERAFELTDGQPWLVNALANEIIVEMAVTPPTPITAAHVEKAAERLIQARATHLDSLVDKLNDPRVRAIIEPLITGTPPTQRPKNDDIQYVRDLGLLAQDAPVRPANPIYNEVIVRALTDGVLEYATDVPQPRAYVLPDGRMDFTRLLTEFAAFWTANGDILVSQQIYHEAAPHLVLQAYLQRVVNGGGTVLREYGVGRGRLDLLVTWPYRGPEGAGAVQRQALELKVRAEGDADPLGSALVQLDGYLDRLGSTPAPCSCSTAGRRLPPSTSARPSPPRPAQPAARSPCSRVSAEGLQGQRRASPTVIAFPGACPLQPGRRRKLPLTSSSPGRPRNRSI
ncbi:ATP-binding protein [Frankia sp. Cj3]|uniref:ATP-binding protein n=1 Tax=Frankia sp. Cj3 TaxID=2880976 RepID=UPI001EF4E700|nr:ATP-binding protein [Frankia sp. Cj3]